MKIFHESHGDKDFSRHLDFLKCMHVVCTNEEIPHVKREILII